MSSVKIRNDEFVVKLHTDEMESFLAKAIEKSNKYNSLITKAEKVPYGFNHVHSHYVGMLAEHASWVLFNYIEEMSNRNLDIIPVYQDNTRDSECDIIVNNMRIEVKSMKYSSWKKYGACISTKQLSKLQKKADVVIWVLLNEKRGELTFKGFNNVSDVHGIEPILTGVNQVPNICVNEIIKPLVELGI